MSSALFQPVRRLLSTGGRWTAVASLAVAAQTLAAHTLAPQAGAQDAPKPQPVAAAPAGRTALPLKLAPRPTKGAITADDLSLRVSEAADGPEAVSHVLAFAKALSEATARTAS